MINDNSECHVENSIASKIKIRHVDRNASHVSPPPGNSNKCLHYFIICRQCPNKSQHFHYTLKINKTFSEAVMAVRHNLSLYTLGQHCRRHVQQCCVVSVSVLFRTWQCKNHTNLTKIM